jgi:hypothetical protein
MTKKENKTTFQHLMNVSEILTPQNKPAGR